MACLRNELRMAIEGKARHKAWMSAEHHLRQAIDTLSEAVYARKTWGDVLCFKKVTKIPGRISVPFGLAERAEQLSDNPITPGDYVSCHHKENPFMFESRDFNYEGYKKKTFKWNPIKYSWRFNGIMTFQRWKKWTNHVQVKKVAELVRVGLKVNQWDNTIPTDPIFRKQWDEFDEVHKENTARMDFWKLWDLEIQISHSAWIQALSDNLPIRKSW